MSSLVWDFYTKPKNRATHVTCPLCKNELYFYGSTSALLRHLKHSHSDVYEDIKMKRVMKGQVSTQFDKECMEEFAEKGPEKSLARSFATGLIPFRFASNPDFIHFCQQMNRSFKVPSPSTMKILLEKEKDEYQEELIKELSDIKSFVLITDGFSELNKPLNVYSVHVFFVNSKFKRVNKFIGIRQPVDGSSAPEISTVIVQILNSVGLNLTCCTGSVTDGDATLKSVFGTHLLDNAHCACHVINLIFDDFSKHISSLKTEAQKIAHFLSRKKKVRKEIVLLSRSMNINVPLPQSLAPTRWSSLYFLLNSLKENYGAISSNVAMQDILLSKKNVTLMPLVLDLLKPLHLMLKRLEGDSTYVSDVLPELLTFRDELATKEESHAQILHGLVDTRLKNYKENGYVLSCMVADPRFAFHPNLMDDWNVAEAEFKSRQRTTFPSKDARISNAMLTGVAGFLQKDCKTINSDIDSELLTYRASFKNGRPEFESNPLDYWAAHAMSYPNMSEIAKDLLAAPASSAVAERLFSKCSDIVRQKKRNRIKPETMNAILMTAALSKSTYSNQESIDNSDIEDSEVSDEENFDDEPLEWDDPIFNEYPTLNKENSLEGSSTMYQNNDADVVEPTKKKNRRKK